MPQYASSLHTVQAYIIEPTDLQFTHSPADFTAEEIEVVSFELSIITTESTMFGAPMLDEQNGQVTQSSWTSFPHSLQNGTTLVNADCT